MSLDAPGRRGVAGEMLLRVWLRKNGCPVVLDALAID
jgi:hypothetical protein